jgi:hypoxanthine-guanine phosphoribosyltransferase
MRVPILSPVVRGESAAFFKQEKLRLKGLGYPNKETFAFVTSYFNSVKDKIKGVDQNSVLAMVPSGSFQNKVTMMEHFKCQALPFNAMTRASLGEAKNNLSLQKRVLNPIRYSLDEELVKKATQGRSLIIIDDVLATGESAIRLQHSLERKGISVDGIASLVTIEKQYPSEADTKRLIGKLKSFGVVSDEEALLADIKDAFSPYTRQRQNRLEREITSEKSALKAVGTIRDSAQVERSIRRGELGIESIQQQQTILCNSKNYVSTNGFAQPMS